MHKIIFSLFALLGFAIPGFASSWYVDKTATGDNSGSSWSNAWRSFTDIQWDQLQPGDVIFISGGQNSKTYFETLVVPVLGTKDNPITIRVGQDTGHNGQVIIDGEQVRQNNISFTSGAGHVIIDGNAGDQIHMIIINAAGDGILAESANHLELAYLEIAHNGNRDQGNGFNVDVSAAAGGNKIHYCKIHDNYDDQIVGYLGAPAPDFTFFEIYQNEIYNLHDDGIEMNAGGLLIHDNLIRTRIQAIDHAHADAIQIEGAQYIKIYNNVIRDLSFDVSGGRCNDCDSNALIFVDPVGNPGTTHAHDIYIYNNLVYETIPPIAEVLVRGISYKLEDNILSTSNVYIVNNTIVDIPLWGISVTFNHSNQVREVFVENNIVFNTAQIGDRRAINIGREGSGGGFTLGSHGEGRDVTIDYNLVHPGAAGSTRIGLHEATYEYDDFKTTIGIQKHDVTTAPGFVLYQPNDSSNVFQLSGRDTAAKDRGIPQLFFATDQRDVSRPQGAAWDIGAFEFSSDEVFIVTSELPDADEGIAYVYALQAINGSAPYSWRIVSGGLPAELGLSLQGVINGIPRQTGASSFEVNVTDSQGKSAKKRLSLQVKPDLAPELLAVRLRDVSTLEVIFSEELERFSAENVKNYSITPALTVLQASLSKATVVLTTGAHRLGEKYRLCVSGVKDSGPEMKAIAPNSCLPYEAVCDIVLEAESGTLNAPMMTGSDGDASGGAYIFTPVENQGKATFHFNVIKTGWYAFTAKVLAPDFGTNSFSFNVDNGETHIWDIVSTPSNWSWVGMSIRGNGRPTSPEVDTLFHYFANGEHALQILGREKQTKLDQIKIVCLEDDVLNVDDPGSSIPRNFFIRNYPNPFHLSTTVQYSIPALSHVEIKVYNSAGQFIRLLKYELMPAGNHNLQWDGRDKLGYRVANGLYFYEIKAGSKRLINKMLLLKDLEF